MTWYTTGDIEEYLAVAGGFLRSRPAENTVLLTVAETLRARGRHVFGNGDLLFGWWRPANGGIGSALLQTPPFPVLLTRSPGEAVTALAPTPPAAHRPPAALNACADAPDLFPARVPRVTGGMAT